MLTLSHFREKFVRISRFFGLIIVGIVLGQGDPIRINAIQSSLVLDSLNMYLEKSPNLSHEFKLDSYGLKPPHTTYEIFDHEKIVDTLIVASTEEIRPKILYRISSSYAKAPIGSDFDLVGKQLARRYFFLNEIPKYELGLVRKDHIGAIIEIEPWFESHFSGLFGMSKMNQSWDLTGEIDLHLENILRTAGMIDLFWKRIDSLSQVIRFDILETHPFGWDLGVNWQYHHEVVLGQYTVIENRSMVQTFVPWIDQFRLGYVSGRTIPTNDGESNGYESVVSKAISLASLIDYRNDRLLPSRGFLLNTTADVGLQEQSTFIKGEVEFQYYRTINPAFHGLFKVVGKGIHDFENEIPKTRYFIYGGASSMRGYREQQFSDRHYYISTMKLAYKPASFFQADLFLDHGLSPSGQYMGYGVGFTQINKESIIKVQFALPKRGTLSEGKLHIKWISRL